MKQLPIGKSGQHGFTLVDDCDADIAGSRTISKTHYGYCHIASYYSKNKDAQLHRLIMERMVGRPLTQDEVIDHLDGDPRNNQRNNLCITTNRGNQQNLRCHRDGKLVGAGFQKKSGKWRAQIKIDGKLKHLGNFLTAAEAHQAYLVAKAAIVISLQSTNIRKQTDVT